MGMRFRLNPKWVSPVHSHYLSSSHLRLSPSHSVKGRDTSLSSTKLTFLSIISEEDGIFFRYPFKACSHSPEALNVVESDYSQEFKVGFNRSSYNSLYDMIDHVQRPVETNNSALIEIPRRPSISNFSLLMDNLDALEKTFVDSDILRLEREILRQLGRLGALKSFNTCLSMTSLPSDVFDLSDVPTENITEHKTGLQTSDYKGKIVVSSNKKTERKLRRERASQSSSSSLPSKTVQKASGRPTVSATKRTRNSKHRRLLIARNEAEWSKGFKVLINLERIRTMVENELGKVVSLRRWAEAARFNEKELQHHLHVGWHCRDELLRTTHSLVLYLARNYRGLGVAYEDLVQAGKLGVLQGAERFDHTRGYRFSTYVQYWIRKSMSMMVARHGRGIQIPCMLSRALNKIQKARKSLRGNNGKYPDDDEIARFTGLSLSKVRSASKCLRTVGSIDEKVGDSFRAKYMEFMPDMTIKNTEETVTRQFMKKDIEDLLNELDPREKEVLVLRYGLNNGSLPKSLQEIGRHFNASKEWIRKIEKKAMKKLREQNTCTDLSFYLE